MVGEERTDPLYEMETHHANSHLPLYEKGDMPTFVAKRRRAPRNTRLPLLT
jgi:hypothetical protein